MTTQDGIPGLGKASFTCPHCGAIAHQDWYDLNAGLRENNKRVFIPDLQEIQQVENHEQVSTDEKAYWIKWARRLRVGEVFFSREDWRGQVMQVNNAWISLCFSCQKLAVWVHDRMLFPRHDHHIAPNADLPDEIKKDFLEAAEILDASPRGSAALLRLCIQKLCKHLGKSGDNINKDIADLVQDGLDKRIKNSLDIVRVIGNNAVHPGQINLTDDKDTASSLFKIVNFICETMINQPKHIDELYELIPPSTKKQIEKRDEAAELKKREKETS